ncbi:hypothetical protein GCM10022403_041070 [Streptomyces coacervatus]|uniref:Uncharacterized protein n=1 Tax=Streptomyces coacervatus TaxID=647381 RepID=A0ABP7HZS7_9ACTN|nr:hypothetical protein [Streptomyces coacervatus]MDF2267307.1 hypothetical protein [Streptomyces coacervatus]
MFRLLYDCAVRLFTRSRSNGCLAPGDWALTQESRVPDPYVWRLPNPYDARWRRWARRNREAGHRLPFLCDEECWRVPARPREFRWETSDDVVRPYVVSGGR